MNKPNLEVFIDSGFDMEFRKNHTIEWNIISQLKEVIKKSGNKPDTCDSRREPMTWSTEFYFPTISVETKFPINCRPRLNKQQVLDDYSFIESLEGFVWDIAYHCYDEVAYDLNILTGNYSPSFIVDINGDIQWLSFKGVQKGSIFEEWAIENDVPVLEV